MDTAVINILPPSPSTDAAAPAREEGNDIFGGHLAEAVRQGDSASATHESPRQPTSARKSAVGGDHGSPSNQSATDRITSSSAPAAGTKSQDAGGDTAAAVNTITAAPVSGPPLWTTSSDPLLQLVSGIPSIGFLGPATADGIALAALSQGSKNTTSPPHAGSFNVQSPATGNAAYDGQLLSPEALLKLPKPADSGGLAARIGPFDLIPGTAAAPTTGQAGASQDVSIPITAVKFPGAKNPGVVSGLGLTAVPSLAPAGQAVTAAAGRTTALPAALAELLTQAPGITLATASTVKPGTGRLPAPPTTNPTTNPTPNPATNPTTNPGASKAGVLTPGLAALSAGNQSNNVRNPGLPSGGPLAASDPTTADIGAKIALGLAGNSDPPAAVKGAAAQIRMQPLGTPSAAMSMFTDPASAPNAQTASPTAGPASVAAPAIEAGVMTTARPTAGLATAAIQVALHVSRGVEAGLNRFTIRLHPAELGRVDVNMELAHDGRVMVVLSADRQETLDLLQRDSRHLERALQDSGLKADSNSLNFSLRDQDGRREFEAGAAKGNTEQDQDAGSDALLRTNLAAAFPGNGWGMTPRALDITV